MLLAPAAEAETRTIARAARRSRRRRGMIFLSSVCTSRSILRREDDLAALTIQNGEIASPLLGGNAEAALHATGGVRVALVRVLARPQLDRPGLVTLEGNRRGLVQPGPDQMEVVDRSLVLDLDRVRARLERLHVLAGGGLDFDREAWA